MKQNARQSDNVYKLVKWDDGASSPYKRDVGLLNFMYTKDLTVGEKCLCDTHAIYIIYWNVLESEQE